MINFTAMTDAPGEQNGVYNHTLTSPIEFKKGDIFGILYYHRRNRKMVLYNQLTTGPANYWDPAGTLGSPPTYNNLSAVYTDTYDYTLSLVSVEIGEHNIYYKIIVQYSRILHSIILRSSTITNLLSMVMLCIIVVIVTSSQVPIPTVVQGGIQPPSMIGMLIHCIVLKPGIMY